MTFRPEFPATQYRAKVVRVIDGDTFEVEVDLGFRVMRSMRIRLLGVDTPELRRGSAESKKKGAEAKAWVEDLILGRWVLIDSTTTKSFDRWVAAVHFCYGLPSSVDGDFLALNSGNGESGFYPSMSNGGEKLWHSLADNLIEAGHAKPMSR
tara:strand:+ start:267 stop:722 length:456 start_codon:yes stop_codon:yes gene_type:complete